MAVTINRGVGTIVMTATSDEINEHLNVDRIDFQATGNGTMTVVDLATGARLAIFEATTEVRDKQVRVHRKANGAKLTLSGATGSITINLAKRY